LLLEHGQSNYTWLSGILDKFADLHAQKWGCHWNRDILALVELTRLEAWLRAAEGRQLPSLLNNLRKTGMDLAVTRAALTGGFVMLLVYTSGDARYVYPMPWLKQK
ncbi:hypothetical protein PC129_g21678, partial [Phytophthora cactorum]